MSNDNLTAVTVAALLPDSIQTNALTNIFVSLTEVDESAIWVEAIVEYDGLQVENAGLAVVTDGIESATLQVPESLVALLQRAVDERGKRSDEDVDAWADRLAAEAAQHHD
jgi:hypothetical protein